MLRDLHETVDATLKMLPFSLEVMMIASGMNPSDSHVRCSEMLKLEERDPDKDQREDTWAGRKLIMEMKMQRREDGCSLKQRSN